MRKALQDKIDTLKKELEKVQKEQQPKSTLLNKLYEEEKRERERSLFYNKFIERMEMMTRHLQEEKGIIIAQEQTRNRVITDVESQWDGLREKEVNLVEMIAKEEQRLLQHDIDCKNVEKSTEARKRIYVEVPGDLFPTVPLPKVPNLTQLITNRLWNDEEDSGTLTSVVNAEAGAEGRVETGMGYQCASGYLLDTPASEAIDRVIDQPRFNHSGPDSAFVAFHNGVVGNGNNPGNLGGGTSTDAGPWRYW